MTPTPNSYIRFAPRDTDPSIVIPDATWFCPLLIPTYDGLAPFTSHFTMDGQLFLQPQCGGNWRIRGTYTLESGAPVNGVKLAITNTTTGKQVIFESKTRQVQGEDILRCGDGDVIRVEIQQAEGTPQNLGTSAGNFITLEYLGA